jgi:hypothetical protein
MATRKKPEGLAAIMAKQDHVSIQDLTMRDFFAAFALQGLLAHHGDVTSINGISPSAAAFDQAEDMLRWRTT